MIETEMNGRHALVSDINGVKVTTTETNKSLLWEVVPGRVTNPETVREAMRCYLTGCRPWL